MVYIVLYRLLFFIQTSCKLEFDDFDIEVLGNFCGGSLSAAEWSAVVVGGSTVVGFCIVFLVCGLEWSTVVVVLTAVADRSTTLEGLSDHNRWPGLAIYLLTLPQVTHLTTKCLSR